MAALFLSLYCAQAIASQSPFDKTKMILRVDFPSADLGRKATISFHHALLQTNWEDGYLVMELTPEEQGRLQDFGFTLREANDWQSSWQAQKQHFSLNPDSTIPGFECYLTVAANNMRIDELLTEYPDLTDIEDIGDSWEKTQGMGGEDLRVLKLTNNNDIPDKPVIFIQAAIHAREYATTPLVLAYAEYLLEGYANNAEIAWALDYHEVHILLQTNPDGRKQAEQGLFWRKNTNQNHCEEIAELQGVDLNRNFSHTWGETENGSSGDGCSEVFRGVSAASEPETAAIESYLRGIWPDRRGPGEDDSAPADTQGMHIDIHSYSELILWPYGHTEGLAPNADALEKIGKRIANFNDYVPIQSVGLYPTDGTSDSISYGELGVAALGFELGTDFFQDCTTFNNEIKPDNINALFYATRIVSAPYLLAAGPTIEFLAINQYEIDNVEVDADFVLTFSANDNAYRQIPTPEDFGSIQAASYYIDVPPNVEDATELNATFIDGATNSAQETFTATIAITDLSEGLHTLYVRAQDNTGQWGAVYAKHFTVVESANNPVLVTPLPPTTEAPSDGGSGGGGAASSLLFYLLLAMSSIWFCRKNGKPIYLP